MGLSEQILDGKSTENTHDLVDLSCDLKNHETDSSSYKESFTSKNVSNGVVD
jgi:hypothetical protein